MDNVMDRTILEFVYVLAMREATLQLAYEGEKKWLTKVKNDDGTPNKDVEAFVNVLEEHVNAVMGGETFDTQEKYNSSFYKVAEDICNKINACKQNEKVTFSFGNAQKLINMTMKYLYIMCYKNSENRELFRFCHCPMDGILLKHVWDQRKLSNLPGNWKRPDFLASWGKEKDSHERYDAFQIAIKKLKDPDQYALEYDYKIWITKAEKSEKKPSDS